MKFAAVILLVACAEPIDPPPPVIYAPSYKCNSVPSYARACDASNDGATMTVGTVEGATFNAFGEGTNILALNPGPQGGYHAFLKVQTVGLCPTWNLVTMRLKQPGAKSILRLQQFEQGFVADETGTLTVFICPSQLPGLSLNGATLELEVSIVDCTSPNADNTPHLKRTFTVKPTCPAGDSVCTGDAYAGCAAL